RRTRGMTLSRCRLREAGVQNVEVCNVRAADSIRLPHRIPGRIIGSIKENRITGHGLRDQNARTSALLHIHSVRRKRLVRIVRVSVGNLRLALTANPQLQKIPERAVAALAAENSLYAAFMNEMLARENWPGKRR